MGGLTEVGFAKDVDMLLVLSSSGRGVLDCKTGQVIARDKTSSTDSDWYQPTRLEVQGIGPLAGEKIRVAGLLGGGLPQINSENWGLQSVSPDWPLIAIFLSPPVSSVLVESCSKGCVKIAEDFEIRAFGFSPSGKYFVIATSDSVALFGAE
jgi:hypothetical protein